MTDKETISYLLSWTCSLWFFLLIAGRAVIGSEGDAPRPILIRIKRANNPEGGGDPGPQTRTTLPSQSSLCESASLLL